MDRARFSGNELAFATSDGRLSFSELYEDACTLAGRLAAAGVGRADRVVLVLPAGLDFIRCFFAVQLLGAASCALNPDVSEANRERASRAKPRLVVTGLHDLPQDGVAVDIESGRRDDVAFLQPTSGTSGEPRLAMVLQRNVLSLLRSSADGMGLTAEDTFVSWAPPWHDLGLVRFILLPLYVGAPCHLVRPAIETIPLWLRTIEAVRATTTGAPDFAYRLAARMVPPGVDLSSLKHATNGGEPVRSSTIDTFEKHFGVSGVLRPGYGLAEATLGVTTVRAGESISVDPTGAVSCGRPLPGVEIAVEDDEILVRGETVFAGYFDSDESPVVDGWLHTGDAGRIGENGELYVLGRKRAMIKRAGAVIAPRELEEAALTVSGVKVAGATSVGARGRLIEEIVVAVEIEDDERQRIIGDVSQAIYRKLGFAPDRVVIMPGRAIPRTTNGKIRHEALRQLLAGSGRNRSRAGPISPGESDR